MTKDFDRIQMLRMFIQQLEAKLEASMFASESNALKELIKKQNAELKRLERDYDGR